MLFNCESSIQSYDNKYDLKKHVGKKNKKITCILTDYNLIKKYLSII